MTATFSRHCSIDRANRIDHILREIGLGQLACERYTTNQAGRGKYLCLTDTGIMIVKSADKLKIVTVYVATMKDVVYVYDGHKNIPQRLKKIVIENTQKYIREGKTIWS